MEDDPRTARLIKHLQSMAGPLEMDCPTCDYERTEHTRVDPPDALLPHWVCAKCGTDNGPVRG